MTTHDHTVTKWGRASLKTHTCYSLQTTWTTSRRWRALRLWALEGTMMALQSKSDILFSDGVMILLTCADGTGEGECP